MIFGEVRVRVKSLIVKKFRGCINKSELYFEIFVRFAFKGRGATFYQNQYLSKAFKIKIVYF